MLHALIGTQAAIGAQIFAPQFAELKKLNINWDAILEALTKDSADVSFEELTCA